MDHCTLCYTLFCRDGNEKLMQLSHVTSSKHSWRTGSSRCCVRTLGCYRYNHDECFGCLFNLGHCRDKVRVEPIPSAYTCVYICTHLSYLTVEDDVENSQHTVTALTARCVCVCETARMITCISRDPFCTTNLFHKRLVINFPENAK